MFKSITLALLGLCVSLYASASPKQAVYDYYSAIHSGDLGALKKVMVPESYNTTVEIYALSIGLNDKNFLSHLRKFNRNSNSTAIIEDSVSKKLKKAKKRSISEFKVITLGSERAIVKYREDGQKKQLNTSLEGLEWKINYKAGRKK